MTFDPENLPDAKLLEECEILEDMVGSELRDKATCQQSKLPDKTTLYVLYDDHGIKSYALMGGTKLYRFGMQTDDSGINLLARIAKKTQIQIGETGYAGSYAGPHRTNCIEDKWFNLGFRRDWLCLAETRQYGVIFVCPWLAGIRYRSGILYSKDMDADFSRDKEGNKEGGVGK